jgi:spore coat polysaccharide biosynthesis protein SpsF
VNIGASIQARMRSSRLPGKVLKPILGRPMLALQIERIQRSLLIDQIVVATSDRVEDDVIERLSEDLGVACFRGSEEDVLGRVLGALKAFRIDLHVEFMGDNPIPDSLLIDSIIGYYLKNADSCDYVTNALTTTYPPGAEVFVYKTETLDDAESRATDQGLREHVGLHIYQHPERYRICNLEAPPWFRFPDIHLEVDTQEDFEVVTAVYENLYPQNPGFGLGEVLNFMKAHPELIDHNLQVERRWKSFRQDSA